MFAVLVSTMACSETKEVGSKATVIDVDASEFRGLIKENPGIILDVRTKSEFQDGYLKNAVNIDFYASDFKSKLKVLNKEKTIYVYCRSGRRSSAASKILINLGYKKIYNLKGGFLGWKSNNFPIVSRINSSTERPYIVGTPPQNAYTGLVLLDDGEIRHYGSNMYISSIDRGEN